jgi:hypothetical protein
MQPRRTRRARRLRALAAAVLTLAFVGELMIIHATQESARPPPRDVTTPASHQAAPAQASRPQAWSTSSAAERRR